MKAQKKFSFLMLVAASMTLMGCGRVSLNLGGLNGVISGPVTLTNGAEFVASSQHGVRTVNSYQVDASAGASFSKLVATTQSGYQVFSTIEGELTSETEQVAAAAAAAAAVH